MELPVVCSLTQDDLAARRERWIGLAGRALGARESIAEGVRLHFRPLPGVVAELEHLVAAERECCAFADWVIEWAADELVLTVRASGEGAPAIRELFTALG